MFVAACDLLLPPVPAGIVRGDWVWPTSAPVPPGAEAIPLEVRSVPEEVRVGADYSDCLMARLGPVEIAHLPGQDPPIAYHQGDDAIRLIWPVGFSARLNPVLEIVAPDGVVVAREGQPSVDLGGGFSADDETFGVCFGEYTPRRLRDGA